MSAIKKFETWQNEEATHELDASSDTYETDKENLENEGYTLAAESWRLL